MHCCSTAAVAQPVATHTVDSYSTSACGQEWAWECVGGCFDVHGHEEQHVIVLACALQKKSSLHL